MAKQKQEMYTKVDLEELVDMFIEDRLGIEDGPNYSNEMKFKDADSIFGEVVPDGVPCQSGKEDNEAALKRDGINAKRDRETAVKFLGKSLAKAGDELWRTRRDSITRDEVQVEIAKTGQLAETGEIPVEDEEEQWKHFKELLDRALEDIGPNNPYRMMGAVLVTVRGLSHFGRAVAILARRFTLRYFEEHRLARDIERAGGIENLADENLD